MLATLHQELKNVNNANSLSPYIKAKNAIIWIKRDVLDIKKATLKFVVTNPIIALELLVPHFYGEDDNVQAGSRLYLEPLFGRFKFVT